jgi:thiosulfate reductase cytochrome b subunit
MSAIAEVVVVRPEREVIAKHHGLVRLTHWLNVPLLAGLIVSGLAIYWASPVFKHAPVRATGSSDYLADAGIWIARHIGGPTSGPAARYWFYNHFSIGVFSLAQALRLHWLFAYLFMLNGALYLLGLLLGGGYRALLPRRGQLREALRMQIYYFGVIPMKILRRPWTHPPVTTKYNGLQRLAYSSMPVFGFLAIASGWAMHKPAQLGWLERLFVNYDGARIVHFLAMWVFLAFLIPHIVMVVADGWDTFRSMITGWSGRRVNGEE